jgi:hypothetical protein
MEMVMATKHTISRAAATFVGSGYDGGVFAKNGRAGVPVSFLTRVSLGTPAVADAERLVKDATSTELPSNATITYTTANAGASPCDDTGNDTAVTTIDTAYGNKSVWALDVPRNIIATSSVAAAATTITITGYDEYRVKVVETLAIGLGDSAAAGLKAFKWVESVAITSAGDITTDVVDVGFGDVLGLPYTLTGAGDMFRVTFAGATDSATVVKADATTATATTGDIRGTVDPNGTLDGTKEIVCYYVVTNPNTAVGLRGIAQYGG